jgi:transposase
LSFELGEAFQFDWSCEYVFVEGLRRRLEVAHIKLAASRAFLMVAYYAQSHEMLFDAHRRAFEVFGGVGTLKMRLSKPYKLRSGLPAPSASKGL